MCPGRFVHPRRGQADALLQLEKYYGLTYIVVSLVFLSPFVGYVCSAILNNYLHHRVGQRGIAVICGACHAAAYIIIALHPPYIVLVFAFILAGFGNGVADAAWNAWVGNLANSSEVLGLLHACYGVGGAVSPTIATTLITKANLGWYSFYYIMVCSWRWWRRRGRGGLMRRVDWHGWRGDGCSSLCFLVIFGSRVPPHS